MSILRFERWNPNVKEVLAMLSKFKSYAKIKMHGSPYDSTTHIVMTSRNPECVDMTIRVKENKTMKELLKEDTDGSKEE